MHYPATPSQVDLKVTEPSSDFKKEALKVMGSILLFMLVYVLLIALAIGLAILAGYGGIALILLRPSLITLVLGLGLAGLGIMVLFFLVKFLFTQNKVDRSHLIEVSRQQQPDLFAFIERLTKDIGAPFPKRIYFSSDVNASVFYDSGFWSMFLPIRKNLQIGLGLVNTLTLSEFKAVLAHEFGHFSQRSMKLGSYVYNVNQVIFNMLYDNQGYGKALESWGNVNGYFAFFATITVGIVKGIQWLLQQMYGIINKTYMSLSRQMEFHADAVAASAAGSRQLASALLKLDMANATQQKLYQTYNNWLSDNVKAVNMFPHHREVMKQFAQEYHLPLVNGLPTVDENAAKRLASSRVVVNDQWASHPSTEDRVHQLNQLNIVAENANDPAWVIFHQPEQVQENMTEFVYQSVTLKGLPVLLDEDAFRQRYLAETSMYTYPEIYKGYFNNRPITEINPDQPQVRDAGRLAEILTEETLQLPKKLEVLTNDIATVESITENNSGINTFDFDSHRYKQHQAKEILQQLKDEKEQLTAALAYADKRIFALAYHAAEQRGQVEKWKEEFRSWLTCEQQATETFAFYSEIMSIIEPVYQDQVTIDDAQTVHNKLRLNEPKGKDWIRKLLQQSDALPVNEDEKKLLQEFTDSEWTYFEIKTGVHNENLDRCIRVMGLLQYLHAQLSVRAKKSYLEWQAELLRN